MLKHILQYNPATKLELNKKKHTVLPQQKAHITMNQQGSRGVFLLIWEIKG